MRAGKLRTAAGVEVAGPKQIVETVRILDRNQTCVAAVLAATDLYLLKCGSSAVASDLGYCCRPALQQVEVRGSEHSSGIGGESARFAAKLRRCYHPENESLPSTSERGDTYLSLLQSVLYRDLSSTEVRLDFGTPRRSRLS